MPPVPWADFAVTTETPQTGRSRSVMGEHPPVVYVKPARFLLKVGLRLCTTQMNALPVPWAHSTDVTTGVHLLVLLQGSVHLQARGTGSQLVAETAELHVEHHHSACTCLHSSVLCLNSSL